MKFERKPMVGWFDFEQLLHTGIQTIISGTFGNYADRRELQAAVSPTIKYYDYSDSEELGEDFWVDYISDVGDGFNSTYTVANLLAQESLEIDEKILPRGKMLIMGGDEVYPTPELEEYNNRLKGPYKAAYPDELDPDRQGHDQTKNLFPLLFAIPGNHDWYDGLTNFIKLFTQQRRIGNWQTIQERSYFAIKLPHNYWIWGIDVQLNSDIDQPQRKYFEHIAKNEMDNGAKVVLCTAEPAWVYKSMFRENASYDRLSFFERSYIDNDKGWISTEACPNKKHTLVATLTGDLHHYARYSDEQDGREYNHRITAGGGGAFLHPTHNLPLELTGLSGEKPKLRYSFPSAVQSKRLLLGNFFFAFRSWQFSTFMGTFYLLFAWIAQSSFAVPTTIFVKKKTDYQPGSEVYEPGSEVEDFFDIVVRYAASGKSFFDWLVDALGIWLFNPLVLLLLLGLGLGLYKFTDRNGTKTKFIELLGIVHGVAQLISLLFVLWSFVKWNVTIFSQLGIDKGDIARPLIFGVEVFFIGGFVGASIMGLYLYIANRVFGIHMTESFSGLAIEGYKNILKLHFKEGKLSIYPIGIKRVTRDWENVSADPDKPVFKGTEAEIHLIEKEPIVIQ